jgi:transcription initiation factor IIF auxiliary subunit
MWSAFVRLERVKGFGLERRKVSEYMCKIIHRVVFHLHESFGIKEESVPARPGSREVKTRNWKSWGYFDMPIEIHFNPILKMEPLIVTHEISFEGAGASSIKTVTIPEENLRKVLGHLLTR